MLAQEYPNAASIEVGKNANALLRDLGWSDQQIKAALRKPKRHGQATRIRSPRME
jgi:hypothetical protein